MLTRLTTLAVILLAPMIAVGQALSDRVPSDAMLYLGWQGSNDLGPAYQDSHLKGFLDDSQFLQLFNEFLPRLIEKFGQSDPNVAHVSEMLSAIAQPAWKHPSALFFSGVEIHGDQVTPHMGFLVQAGEDAKVLKDKLDEIANLGAQAPFPVKVLDDGKLVGLVVGYDDPKSGIGGGDVKAIRDDATFKKSLAQAGKNPAAVVYVDVQRVLKQIDSVMRDTGANEQDRRQLMQIRDALGVESLRQIIATSGFDGKDWGTQAFVAIPSPRTGLFSLIEDKPLSDQVLGAIPRTSTMAGAARFDLSHLVSTLRQIANRLDRNASRELDNGLRQLRTQSGVDLEKDILATLGDEWAYFSDPATGGRGAFGLTAVNRLKDPARFEESMVKLEDFVAQQVSENMGPGPMPMQVRWQELKTDGLTIHYLGVPFVEPCWTIKDGTLYAGLFPQVIVAAAKNTGRNGQSILQNEGFVALRLRLGGQKASSIQFFDLPKTAPDAYGLWLVITRASGFGDVLGVKAPPMVMPPLDKFIAHLAPAGQVTWADEDGLHLRNVQPFPGAELIASDPWAMLASSALPVALPALAQARQHVAPAPAPAQQNRPQ